MVANACRPFSAAMRPETDGRITRISEPKSKILARQFLNLIRQGVEAFPELRGGLGFHKAEGEACRRAGLARLVWS